ncbi:MAG: CotH kinase family protein [Polyangiales bacterium]|nr:CotH kinase family protein [Myxococcales bacterium]
MPDIPDGGADPCAEPNADAPVYSICVWVDEADLARIHASPKDSIEIPAAATIDGARYTDGEFELHGGSARSWPKKSYRFRFDDDGADYDFFGDGAQVQHRIVLQAAWVDMTFVRAKLAFDLARQMDGLAPRVGYARLYINGELNGLYQVIERIDDDYFERVGLSPDGNVYKAESHDANWGVHSNPLAGFDEKTNEDGIATDLDELFSLGQSTELTEAAFKETLEPILDFEDVFVWHLVMTYALNLDTFTKNYYLYHDPDARKGEPGYQFRIVQWDADTTFGNWWTGERYDHPEEDWLYGSKNLFAARLFKIPEYRRRYLEEFADLLTEDFDAESVKASAEALLERLEPEIRADLVRWERSGDFADERTYLLDTIDTRSDVMRAAVGAALAELDDESEGP